MIAVRPAIPFSEAITGRDGRGAHDKNLLTSDDIYPSINFIFRMRLFGGFCRARQIRNSHITVT